MHKYQSSSTDASGNTEIRIGYEKFEEQYQKTLLYFHNPLWVEHLLNETGGVEVQEVGGSGLEVGGSRLEVGGSRLNKPCECRGSGK